MKWRFTKDYGIIFALIGYVMGFIITEKFYIAIGVTNEMYHIGAIVGGGIVVSMVVVGLFIIYVSP
ncbi:nitrate reductase gamma subunit [Cerasibacillus quisquiliarum]|uniref:NarG-like domain-containing protein n=1 Tax=Cerasibacillus quisquiliarum TaxID=227865 RepID=A0A511UVJ1_9BACI|nr:respiratory nitrate reductase subunit gamma [Cerasibacillus quisquiliarum]MBB5146310.1 nitrate reductase gamma subunit [Cerasibacillus quisquiliarum]GEN30635.1 hypothetical protein CQU01_08730 [Cerasibacillus quisquiliarum]